MPKRCELLEGRKRRARARLERVVGRPQRPRDRDQHVCEQHPARRFARSSGSGAGSGAGSSAGRRPGARPARGAHQRVLQARVEDHREHVGDEVGDDVDRGGEQGRRLDHRERRARRSTRSAPLPSPGYENTDSTTTTPPIRYVRLSAVTLSAGPTSVRQRVAQDDAPARYALERRHPDVFRVEHLDQVVAQHADGVDGHRHHQRHGGENGRVHALEDVVARIDDRERRRDREVHRESRR